MARNPFVSGGQIAQSSTNGDNFTEALANTDRAAPPQKTSPNGNYAELANALSRGAPAGASSRLGTGWAPNALSRGAPAGASSALGGPVPAGGSGKSRAQRILERSARRGNLGAAGMLFNAEQQAGHDEATTDRDDAKFAQQLQFYGVQRQDAQDAKSREREEKATDALNEGRGRAASVTALAEALGSPMAETLGSTLEGITDGKALTETSDAFMKALMKEAEDNRPDNITEMPINKGRNTAILRNGQLFNVLGGEKQESTITPEELLAYGEKFPDAGVSAKLPGGVTVTRQAPKKTTETKPTFRNIPGPMIPDPTMPGKMIEGPPIPVMVNNDGTFEPLRPKPNKSKPTGTSYGDSLFKKK